MASVLSAVGYTSMEVYTGVYAEYTTCALYSVRSSSGYIACIRLVSSPGLSGSGKEAFLAEKGSSYGCYAPLIIKLAQRMAKAYAYTLPEGGTVGKPV